MRLIDATALINRITKKHGLTEIILDVDESPTIDAVEVIRCKDCKYRLHLGPTEHYPETYICRIDNISGTRKAYRDDWFCADGERRTDENDN